MRPDPPRVKDSAMVLHSISNILRLEGKLDESYECHEKALEIRSKFYSSDHTPITDSLNNLNSFLVNQDKYGNISSNEERIRSIYKDSYPPMHYEVAEGYLCGTPKYDTVSYCYQESLRILEEFYPPYIPSITSTLNKMGILLKRQRKYEEASNLFNRALRLFEDYYSSNSVQLSSVLTNIGHDLLNQAELDEALSVYQRVITMKQKVYSSDHIFLSTN
ncbi:unnamed protein product [Adineta ricciae]|uniref:Uncharacterized protein n=1 Tax=Adineta ricciae TaxID=249248 RepID=A0A814TAT2_ADIRI|nr:unnamed protein product [Adineta ricciae]CAF1567966.1 unnamed protein product [Adineta ricciae]